MAPAALDLFALETRARRTIGELIKPLVSQQAADSRKVAEMESKHERLLARLHQVEFALGLNDSKPKVFQNIDDKFAEMRAVVALNLSESNFKVGCCDQKIASLERDLKDCLSSMRSMESLIKVRDQETQRSNQTQQEMKSMMNTQIKVLQDSIEQLDAQTRGSLDQFELKVMLQEAKIVNFEATLKESTNFLHESYLTGQKNSTEISKLRDLKVEAKDFERTRDTLLKQVETIRFATYDNFRVLRATDNFIEKYLPF